MSSIFKPTRSETAQNHMVSVVFAALAEAGTLDDATVSEHPEVFPEWDENLTCKAGTIVSEGGRLYRAIHDIAQVAQNTKPSETPSMWTPIGDPSEEYPTWYQPIGAHDAYAVGDKVSHGGKQWISTVENNVWEPGVYGWDEVSK